MRQMVGGLEYEFYFSISIGKFIIPTDELILFRGVGLNHQPESIQLIGILQSYY